MIGSDVLMGPQTLVEVERLNIVVGRERANYNITGVYILQSVRSLYIYIYILEFKRK